MSKECKKLLSYLLTLVMVISMVCTNGMTVEAATANEMWEESTNELGQTVYSLTSNIMPDTGDGLTLTLVDGETIVLKGNGYQLRAKESSNSKGLSVTGDGTLIIENLEIYGGDKATNDNSCGMDVSGNVNVILRENVTITGGSACTAETSSAPGRNGQKGMNFAGKNLIIDSGSQVTISGSDGSMNGKEAGKTGCDGGTGLSFEGERLMVNPKASLTLRGGNASNGTPGFEIYYMVDDSDYSQRNGRNGGNGGAGMLFNGQLCEIAADATVSATGGTAGKGGAAGCYLNDDFDPMPDTEGKPGTAGTDGNGFTYQKGLVPQKEWLDAASVSSNSITLLYPSEIQENSSCYYASYGSTLNCSILPYPEKDNFLFEGWYSDDAYNNEVSGELSISENICLYAKYCQLSCTVTFNSNGGSAVETQSVSTNSLAKEPAAPSKEGYTFKGWFRDEACTEAYGFDTPVTSDITLYAKWEKIPDNTNNEKTATYTVTFDTNGGSNIVAQTVTEGKQVTAPANPKKKNCGFGGWYTDKECTVSYNFATPITKDTTLYAKWYTVTFNASSVALQKGKSTTAVKATVLKGDAVTSYTSSKTKVATVSKKGKITAKNTGTATITVKTKKGATATVTVKVQKSKVTTKKVSVTNVEKKALTLKKGKSFTLKTSVQPVTTQDKLTYSSSNTKVATVSKSGKIKAKKKGTAKITVQSGKKKVTIKVTVKN